jgi:hypothetical protein
MRYAGGEAARVMPEGDWRVWVAFEHGDRLVEGWSGVGTYADCLAWVSLVPVLPRPVLSGGVVRTVWVRRALIVRYRPN